MIDWLIIMCHFTMKGILFMLACYLRLLVIKLFYACLLLNCLLFTSEAYVGKEGGGSAKNCAPLFCLGTVLFQFFVVFLHNFLILRPPYFIKRAFALPPPLQRGGGEHNDWGSENNEFAGEYNDWHKMRRFVSIVLILTIITISVGEIQVERVNKT